MTAEITTEDLHEFIEAMVEEGYYFTQYQPEGATVPYLAWGIVSGYRRYVVQTARCYGLETRDTGAVLYWEIPVDDALETVIREMQPFPYEDEGYEDVDEREVEYDGGEWM